MFFVDQPAFHPLMNLGALPPPALAPALGGIGAVGVRSEATPGPLGAISGNHLIGLDVWADTGASGRSFGLGNRLPSGDIEQTVSYILSPLA